MMLFRGQETDSATSPNGQYKASVWTVGIVPDAPHSRLVVSETGGSINVIKGVPPLTHVAWSPDSKRIALGGFYEECWLGVYDLKLKEYVAWRVSLPKDFKTNRPGVIWLDGHRACLLSEHYDLSAEHRELEDPQIGRVLLDLKVKAGRMRLCGAGGTRILEMQRTKVE
ncbi:MAG: hypothetical protein WCL39_13995 [Armatimonadota bacterium]